MPDNNEATQKVRARSLRDQFRRLKSKDAGDEPSSQQGQSRNSAEDTKPAKESPREFIHRRMRELDAPTESATKSRKR